MRAERLGKRVEAHHAFSQGGSRASDPLRGLLCIAASLLRTTRRRSSGHLNPQGRTSSRASSFEENFGDDLLQANLRESHEAKQIRIRPVDHTLPLVIA